MIGSQAILGRYPQAPAELVVSADVDLFPRNHPERADLIEGSIGEFSPFHETYGYYAQGVGERTAVLPEGWESRLVPIPTPAGTGLCLEPHDSSSRSTSRAARRTATTSARRPGIAWPIEAPCSSGWRSRLSARSSAAGSPPDQADFAS